MKKKILFVCTGNSCRSQMAEGIANSLGWKAYSAGTKPELEVNPYAILVMSEIGIDIKKNYPKLLDQINLDEMDVIMTVCSNADENCPVLLGYSNKKIHHSFDDPANAIGIDEEKIKIFRKVRDEIKEYLFTL
tara:strand:- start:1264 stop:1662 length:399 start_codon:yes stop_codon:yes gene_type:complete